MRPYNVWVCGEFFGVVHAASKAAVTWFVATVIADDLARIGARSLQVKPR